MKIAELPFEIGSEYELLEFKLEPLEQEIIKGCDTYKYLGEIEFLGKIYRNILLIYNLDILKMVILINDNEWIIYGKVK